MWESATVVVAVEALKSGSSEIVFGFLISCNHLRFYIFIVINIKKPDNRNIHHLFPSRRELEIVKTSKALQNAEVKLTDEWQALKYTIYK